MNKKVTIARLAEHPEAIPVLKQWFESEWKSYYGPTGPGNAERDLLAYSSRDRLPIGIVAYLDGELCGFAALKPQSITTHSHLSPWIAAGLVAPQHRRKGIGAQMLGALEDIARGLGYKRIYSGTSTAGDLLCRSGWQFMERVAYNGEDVSIYEKAI
jgi:GNAT superfamily N-acetyltransferase